MKQRLIACLAAAMFCIMCSCSGLENVNQYAQWTASSDFDSLSDEVITVAENKGTTLTITPSTMKLGLQKNGYNWESWSFFDVDPKETTEKALDSLFVIHGYLIDGTEFVLDSWLDCINKGQYTVSVNASVLEAVFTVGTITKQLLLPEVIRETVFEEQVLSKLNDRSRKRVVQRYRLYTPSDVADMEESERDSLLKEYPFAETETVYILRDDLTDKEKNTLVNYIAETNYTEQMLMQEYQALGYAEEKEEYPVVELTMRFWLDDGDLMVSIPASSLRYDTSRYVIKSIDCMRALTTVDKGGAKEIFYPDGCGAMIDLSREKYNLGYISKRVYGDTSRQNNSNTSQIMLPVFGSIRQDAAMLAIIEGGDALAAITADYFGTVQRVYASFFHQEVTSEGTKEGDNVIRLNYYNMELPTEEYRVRYKILTESNVGYADLARTYQSYLVSAGVLSDRTTNSAEFYLETLGAVNVKEQFGLLPVDRTIALTTYVQNQELLQKLMDNGVTAPILKMTAALNHGLNNSGSGQTKLIGELGGKDDFLTLLEWGANSSVDIYPDVALMNVARNKIGDGFSPSDDAARQLDNRYLGAYTKDVVNGNVDRQSFQYVLSPVSFKKTMQNLLKDADKLWKNTLSLGRLGQNVYEDYRKTNVYNRQEATAALASMLADVAETRSLMLSGANAFVWKSTSHILDIPYQSSEYCDYTATVPFLQMVLHGYKNYASSALNLDSDVNTALLKAIEYGSGISFTLAAQNQEKLKNTAYSYYFSVDASYWIPLATKFYQQLQTALADTAGQRIVDHGAVQQNVMLTAYENGKQVLVNYTDQPVVCNGVTVPARSYAKAQFSSQAIETLLQPRSTLEKPLVSQFETTPGVEDKEEDR